MSARPTVRLPAVVELEVREPVPPWEVERTTTAALYQLGRLAADVGRLRRRLAEPGYDRDLLGAIAARIETLLALFEETAAELVRAGVDVETALATVERRAREARLLLGGEAA